MVDTYGASVVALAHASNVRSQIAYDRGAAAGEAIAQNIAHKEYVFRAKSHVHGLRAEKQAHQRVEDQLIAALKAENANHPLASSEAVNTALDREFIKALTDPEVIKRTYPDGRLPEGAIIPPDGTLRIA